MNGIHQAVSGKGGQLGSRGGNWAPQELVEDNEMAPSGSEISRKQL